MNEIMIVTEIDNQGDRILLYGAKKDYYIITKANIDVKIGDSVEYEPFGFNFGWFVKIIK